MKEVKINNTAIIITRKSSCRKPNEVYHPQHNLSGGGDPPVLAGGTPLLGITQSWAGVPLFWLEGTPVLAGGTSVLECLQSGLGYPLDQDWGTLRKDLGRRPGKEPGIGVPPRVWTDKQSENITLLHPLEWERYKWDKI